MIIKGAKVFNASGSFEERTVCIQGERLIPKQAETDQEVIDGSGMYLIPGLTDIHFHGCVGYDFCDGTIQAIEAMAAYQARNGVTTICPATMTLPEETLLKIAKTAAAYENRSGAVLCGINMEGPFISSAKKGAQNGAYIHKPDLAMFERLQTAANGLFKLVDIAPETEAAMTVISALKDQVVVSLAHTEADYDIASEALSCGASHITHLYNAMPPYSHRAPGVIGAACDAEMCEVELICDGIHIHPAAVRTTFKMFGDDRIILISDSMMATGMPDGEYALGGQAVTVKGNLAVLHDGTIAGSVTNLMDCMRMAVKEMHIPLGSAVKCAAVNSAKSIGIYSDYGSIEPGKVANLVLLREDLSIAQVILKGKVL